MAYNNHCGIRCKCHSTLALDNCEAVEVVAAPLLLSCCTDLVARTKALLSLERTEVTCVREEVSLAHRKALLVAHDCYEQIEVELVGGFGPEEEEHGQIGLDLTAKDSEDGVDDEDMALVGNQVLRDNRTDRERNGMVAYWWESKASCQEDTVAYSQEGQEEGNRKDGLQVELQDMVIRSLALVLLEECWTHR